MKERHGVETNHGREQHPGTAEKPQGNDDQYVTCFETLQVGSPRDSDTAAGPAGTRFRELHSCLWVLVAVTALASRLAPHPAEHGLKVLVTTFLAGSASRQV